MNQKFSCGMLNLTMGVFEKLGEESAYPFLARHLSGDWGDMDEEDKATNDWAVDNGSRILSSYNVREGLKVWIITEADRSATTILLPEEY